MQAEFTNDRTTKLEPDSSLDQVLLERYRRLAFMYSTAAEEENTIHSKLQLARQLLTITKSIARVYRRKNTKKDRRKWGRLIRRRRKIVGRLEKI